jgi:hypothetical protein
LHRFTRHKGLDLLDFKLDKRPDIISIETGSQVARREPPIYILVKNLLRERTLQNQHRKRLRESCGKTDKMMIGNLDDFLQTLLHQRKPLLYTAEEMNQVDAERRPLDKILKYTAMFCQSLCLTKEDS